MPVVSRGIWILVFLWMAGILYTSSLGQAITPVGGVLQTLVAKLGHVVEYAILGALLLWALLREVGGGASPLKAVILTAFLGMLFASVDELRQSFSPGREPRVTDVFIDLASMLGDRKSTRLNSSHT